VPKQLLSVQSQQFPFWRMDCIIPEAPRSFPIGSGVLAAAIGMLDQAGSCSDPKLPFVNSPLRSRQFLPLVFRTLAMFRSLSGAIL
jgi:hypothetical protein